MQKSVECSGRTLEEAIEAALNELCIPSDEAEIEVLEEARGGVFGFGGRMARVRVTALSEAEMKERAAAFADVARQRGEKPAEAPQKKSPTRPATTATKKADMAPIVDEKPVKSAKPVAEKQPVASYDASVSAGEARSEISAQRVAELGQAFVAQVIKGMGLEAEYDVRILADGVHIDVKGPNMGKLIGYRGETLDALQYLASMVVSREGRGPRLWINTEDYREKRRRTLVSMAMRAADQVNRTGGRVALDPMGAADRRILHTALQDRVGITTTSEGEEPYRRVVVMKSRDE